MSVQAIERKPVATNALDMNELFLNARHLAEMSNIARRLPAHPELADLRQVYSEQVAEAIQELRKVIDNV